MAKVKFELLELVETDFDKPLAPGEYEGTIREVRVSSIRSGSHKGKKALDVAVQMPDGRYVWKVIPLFTKAYFDKLAQGDKTWVRMSTMSFMKAMNITSADVDPQDFVGKSVNVVLGMHNSNNEYGAQNSIVKFI